MSKLAEKRAATEIRKVWREDKMADKKSLQRMAARITALETALKLHDAIAEADRQYGDDAMWTRQYEEACEATTAALAHG